MFVRYHTWDAKTIQTGKVTLVDEEGERTEVFDPAAAQQVTETKIWQPSARLRTRNGITARSRIRRTRIVCRTYCYGSAGKGVSNI